MQTQVPPPPGTRPRLLWASALAGVAATALAAWQGGARAWLCDDAFVSFRYARNLVDGVGLVYNAGERVEGMTNLAWTVALAGALATGLSAEQASIALGLLAHAAVTAALAWWSWAALRRRGAQATWPDAIPVAALAWAAMRDSAIWATSGLETAACAATMTWGLLRTATEGCRSPRGLVLTGLVFALGATLRPDGVLAFGVAAAWLLVGAGGRPWVPARSARALLALGAGFAPPWLLTLAFRWGYYGSLVPNTWYAKSAHLPWWDQGLAYLELFLRTYPVLLLGPLGLAAVLLAGTRRGETAALAGRHPRGTPLLLLAATLVYGTYVTRVGGDFMFARVLMPVVPLLLIGLEDALAAVPARLAPVRPLLVAAVAASLYTASPPVDGGQWARGVADEWRYYDAAAVHRAEVRAQDLRHFLGGLQPRYVILASELREVYLAGLPVVIDAQTGLTDAVIARQPTPEPRGRIGHEKVADLGYLVGRRKAHLTCADFAVPVLGLDAVLPLVAVRMGSLSCHLLHWDPAFVAALRARGVAVADVPAEIDRVIAQLDQQPDGVVAEQYRRLRWFYFDHLDDPAREGPFRERLGLAFPVPPAERASWEGEAGAAR